MIKAVKVKKEGMHEASFKVLIMAKQTNFVFGWKTKKESLTNLLVLLPSPWIEVFRLVKNQRIQMHGCNNRQHFPSTWNVIACSTESITFRPTKTPPPL